MVLIGDADHLAEIRTMSGGPSDTEITPAKLQSYFTDAKNWVELGIGTNVSAMSPLDIGYSNVKDAITFRASTLIRYGWRDKENKAQEHASEARRLIMEIIKSMEQATSASSTSSFLTTTDYRTQNMIESQATFGVPYQSPDFGA